jgi:hypothetical protein
LSSPQFPANSVYISFSTANVPKSFDNTKFIGYKMHVNPHFFCALQKYNLYLRKTNKANIISINSMALFRAKTHRLDFFWTLTRRNKV